MIQRKTQKKKLMKKEAVKNTVKDKLKINFKKRTHNMKQFNKSIELHHFR